MTRLWHAYGTHIHAYGTHIHANETCARRDKRACMWKAILTTCMHFCHAWNEFWVYHIVMCHYSHVRAIYINVIGVHKRIIGVDTRTNKICVRRAKVRACGRLA